MRLIRRFAILLISALTPLVYQKFELQVLRARGYGYDPGTESEVQVALSLLQLEETSLIAFDIGANYGDYTSALLKQAPNSYVHAFEPSPPIHSRLRERFEGDERVDVHQFGFSNHTAEVQLFSDNFNGKMSSLAKRNLEHLNVKFDLATKISVRTLNDYCTQANVIPHLIKIDVEGFEFQVIQGAAELLSQIRLIQFEFGGTNIDTKVFFRDFWEILVGAGFEIFRLTPRGLVRIERYSETHEVFVFSNFYARSIKLK
jgi:FkbM family methyltransferase